jgi:hypothetical protein
MIQLIKHSSMTARRLVAPRRLIVGLVAIAALLLGSFGTGAQAATPKTIAITAADNGRVITVDPGTHINVSLASSNWTFSTQGTRKVVTLVSTNVTKGATPGATQACVPGRSCASVKAVYFALEPGLMRLIARLTSCPTGTTCSASQSHWTVVIRVR